MSENDHIGVVRPHRWISAEAQRKRLEADGCRIIVALDGKKDVYTRAELEKITRSTTVIKIVHAFLLGDPKRRRLKGGLKADFLAALKRLVCKPPAGRGATLKDVATGLVTSDPEQKRALIASAKDHITRDGKGLKSALNGARNRGRAKLEVTADELARCKAIWRNVKDYPDWDAAEAGMQKIVPKFTRWRANRLWGTRG